LAHLALPIPASTPDAPNPLPRRRLGFTTAALLDLLFRHAPEVYEHQLRTARLCALVGARLGLGQTVLELTVRTAELHDVGKLALSRNLLDKREPLDEFEWRLIRKHTLLGERLLECVPEATGIAGLVRATHERYDGTGYPDGLAGATIPLPARIVAVCDAFDAMTQPREYRSAIGAYRAIGQVARGAGTQFDPEVADELCLALMVRP
jgi:HD-GYP domain-containing protein (c-di-GMP phosphodiesterase class II)